MITTGAASESTYTQGYTLVYQAYTPASGYLAGAIDMLASLDASAKKIAIVHENDKFSTDVATAAEAYATSKGYEIVLNEGYDTGTTDFSAIINKVQAAAPDAVLGGGHFADGSTLARQISEKNLSVKLLALLVAPAEPTFSEIGDAALGVVGPSQWEPGVTYTEDTAKLMNVPWFGPTTQEFVDAYKAAYNEDPSYHSAGGYTAGLLLGKAMMDAGSTETDAIKAALDQMDLMTFFGHIKFDTSAEKHGLQIGHTMVYIQWQQDADGNLVKETVWPSDVGTASAVYPKP
jgi:branched-chain amino acid transport system substrate-binding protein